MILSSRNLNVSASKKDKFSCIVISLPEAVKNKIKKWAKDNIDKDDLFFIDDNRGYEIHPHITVKYGLYTDDSDEVRDFLKEQPPVYVKLGPISKFRDVSDEFDIIKIEAYGEDMQEFNKAIDKAFDAKKGHKRYLPHITLAYVKKGACDSLVGNKHFKGLKFEGSRFVFLDQDSEPYLVKVASRVDYIKEGLPSEFWYSNHGVALLRPEVEEFINDRLRRTIGTKLKGMDKWLVTKLIGSSIATQFWKEDSDIDIKLVIDEKEFKKENPEFGRTTTDQMKDSLLEIFDEFKGKPIFQYKKHPMEIYPTPSSIIQTEDFLNHFDSLYDIDNHVWIKSPKMVDPDDYDRDETVMEGEEMALEWAHGWDMDLGRLKRKVKEFELVLNHLKTLSPERKAKFKDKIENLKQGLTDDIEKLYKEKELVKKEYNDSYESYDDDLEKYYGSVNALPEVIRIKMLNMWGYISIIKALNKIIENKDEIEASDVKKIDEALKKASVISSRVAV